MPILDLFLISPIHTSRRGRAIRMNFFASSHRLHQALNGLGTVGRVFYDIVDDMVEILAVVEKSDAA